MSNLFGKQKALTKLKLIQQKKGIKTIIVIDEKGNQIERKINFI